MAMEDKNRVSLDTARQELTNELDKLVKSSRNLLEPLRKLDELQIAALVMFGYLMRIIQLAGRPAANIDEGILNRLNGVIDEICPPLGRVVISKDPCFDASTSYVAALKKCRGEDPPRSEDECFEAWGPGARAVMCTMRELEEMKGQMGDIGGRLKPPGPISLPK
jgi:hypothetical protein